MTMLTRCAACKTAFRITTEQLVLRQGKVRCGACGEVFSALEHLVHTRDDIAATPIAHEAGLESATASASLAGSGAVTAEVALHGPPRPDASTAAEIDSPMAPDNAAAGLQPSVNALSRPAPHHWGSIAGSLLALAVLCAQVVYFYRDEVAARLPEAKPWLEQMCAQLTCKADVPRDVQAISIESHDLQADPANKSLLSLIAILRNRAAFAQDSPYLELTLIDAQDAPIARRVLAPRDYFGIPRMAAGAELQVRVQIDASQVKASGYRLYAFFP